MLSTDAFARFAKTVVPFLHVTTHLRGEKHPNLLQEKGGRGWPYLVALDETGRVVAELRGDESVESFRNMMSRGRRYVSLSEKKHKTTKEEVELFEADERLGRMTLDQAKTRVAAIGGLSAKRRQELLVLPEVKARLKGAQSDRDRVEAGDYFWKMYRKGRVPKESKWNQRFFVTIMDAAVAEGRPARFRAALSELRKRFGKDPGTDHFFRVEEERLKELEQRVHKEKPTSKGASGKGR